MIIKFLLASCHVGDEEHTLLCVENILDGLQKTLPFVYAPPYPF